MQNPLQTVCDILKERGISKEKFQRELGLSESYIYTARSRGTIPSKEILGKMAEYLNVTVDSLYGLNVINYNITESEYWIVQMYRKLNEVERAAIRTVIESMAQ